MKPPVFWRLIFDNKSSPVDVGLNRFWYGLLHMIVKHARIYFLLSLVRYQTPLPEILPKYANLSDKTQLNSPVLRPGFDLLSKINP